MAEECHAGNHGLDGYSAKRITFSHDRSSIPGLLCDIQSSTSARRQNSFSTHWTTAENVANILPHNPTSDQEATAQVQVSKHDD